MMSILCRVALLLVLVTAVQSAAIPEFGDGIDLVENAIPRMKRKAVTNIRQRWTNNTVPYTMTGFSAEEEANIKQAIPEWENKTCLVFRDVEDTDAHYIDFVNTGGCWSRFGMTYWREERSQEITLGASYCKQVPLILHEIGHAIGFFHEIQRPDRDEYLTLHTDNINILSAFEKKETSLTFGAPYDFYSIMHYNDKFLSSNGNATFTAVEPAMQGVGGSAQHLSQRDAWVANAMYGCADHCENEDCLADAYKDKDCNCVCAGPASQPKSCSETEEVCTNSTYELIPGHQFMGGVYYGILNVSLCQVFCDDATASDSMCLALDFDLSRRSCWLHFNPDVLTSDLTANQGVDHYVKHMQCAQE